nr:IS200/IS605 family transposase [Brucella haematophila]
MAADTARSVLYGALRPELQDLFIRLSLQKGCLIEEEHLMPDHVHMPISIPPKCSVARIAGFLKGTIARYVADKYAKKRKYHGYHFGREGTSFRPSVTMNRSLDAISAIRKRPTRIQIMRTFLRALINT